MMALRCGQGDGFADFKADSWQYEAGQISACDAEMALTKGLSFVGDNRMALAISTGIAPSFQFRPITSLTVLHSGGAA